MTVSPGILQLHSLAPLLCPYPSKEVNSLFVGWGDSDLMTQSSTFGKETSRQWIKAGVQRQVRITS